MNLKLLAKMAEHLSDYCDVVVIHPNAPTTQVYEIDKNGSSIQMLLPHESMLLSRRPSVIFFWFGLTDPVVDTILEHLARDAYRVYCFDEDEIWRIDED